MLHPRLDRAQTAMSAVGRLLIATSPDPIMSSTASISIKPEKPIGSWAASGPQEAPAKTTRPLPMACS